MKLMIATPFYSVNGFAPYIVSLAKSIQILDKIGIEWCFNDLCGDSYVDRAKNDIVDKFFKSDFTDLLLIDSDMSWNEQGLLHLLRSPFDLTGGAYPMKNRWDFFTEKIVYDKNHAPAQDMEAGLIESEYLAGGFLRMTKQCIAKMYRVYGYDWYYANEEKEIDRIINLFECKVRDHWRRGEDIVFCEKWRAMGEKCYIEPRIDFGHCGMTMHTGNLHKFLSDITRHNKDFGATLNRLETSVAEYATVTI